MFAFRRNKTISGLQESGYSRQRQNQNTAGRVWLASQLKHRVQILEPLQEEENNNFGFTQKYKRLKTIWGGMFPISHMQFRRWVSVEDYGQVSHEFIFRYNAVEDLHKQFSTAFDSGVFDNVGDLMPLKGSMFLFIEKSISGVTKGRLFRIRRIMNNDENDEYISVLAEEIEELGTGANFSSDYIS